MLVQRGKSWSATRALAVVAIAAPAALAGCGGGDDEQPEGADLTAVWYPMVAAGEQGVLARYEPAPGSFDMDELIGTNVTRAESEAEKHGCEILVPVEDGAGVPVPIEIDPTRIYDYTEGGVVTEIAGVGGGI